MGDTDYREITRDGVQQFAEATDDHSWIHVDVEKAKAGPFGSTIAHGYLTLSLAPSMLAEVIAIEGISMGVNYGTNKVRFPAPLPIPVVFAWAPSSKRSGDHRGVQAVFEFSLEADGATKPACVAECIFRAFE